MPIGSLSKHDSIIKRLNDWCLLCIWTCYLIYRKDKPEFYSTVKHRKVNMPTKSGILFWILAIVSKVTFLFCLFGWQTMLPANMFTNNQCIISKSCLSIFFKFIIITYIDFLSSLVHTNYKCILQGRLLAYNRNLGPLLNMTWGRHRTNS